MEFIFVQGGSKVVPIGLPKGAHTRQTITGEQSSHVTKRFATAQKLTRVSPLRLAANFRKNKVTLRLYIYKRGDRTETVHVCNCSVNKTTASVYVKLKELIRIQKFKTETLRNKKLAFFYLYFQNRKMIKICCFINNVC